MPRKGRDPIHVASAREVTLLSAGFRVVLCRVLSVGVRGEGCLSAQVAVDKPQILATGLATSLCAL